MKPRAILRAYGLWLLGVFSAAAAAYFLYRSRVISYDLEADYAGEGEEHYAPAAVDLENLRRYTGEDGA